MELFFCEICSYLWIESFLINCMFTYLAQTFAMYDFYVLMSLIMNCIITYNWFEFEILFFR